MTRRHDTVIGLALAVCALVLYVATLLPGVGSGDTAEFQRVVPLLGVAHPTGYPLYTIVGWLWSQLPLGGTPAWRMNLFSALAAALAVGALYGVARAIGQARGVAALTALALAVSFTFWSQATIAEVYALAALIQALLFLALLGWRAGRWPLWLAGLLLGLGLAHHRTIVLMLPGVLAFVLLSYSDRKPNAVPILKELLATLGLAGAGCLLYLYLPLRAPQWIDSWQAFVQYVSGAAALGVWLSTDPPWQVAWEHLRELVQRFIWPQFFPLGALLMLLGVFRIWRRDRALAALLTISYLVVVLFCTLFFVQDVEVFLIPAHLIAALLLGEGVMALAAAITYRWTRAIRSEQDKETRRQGDTETRRRCQCASPCLPVSVSPGLRVSPAALAGLALLLPALLLMRNLTPIRAGNTSANEVVARSILAQPLPQNALLIVDWEAVEGLRYLQAIEGLRPDVEVRPLNSSVMRQDVDTALAAGRATYLLRPQPSLGLAQSPEGRLWRVSDRPPELQIATTTNQRWLDGITLKGFSLPSGPYQPGDIVPLTLDWRAQAAPKQRYALFVHIVGADGTVWGQQDREPARAPTDQWHKGDHTVDVYGPALSQTAPPGRYHVVIGWYEYPSMARLPLIVAQNAAPVDTSTLGEIEVVAGN